MASTAAETAAHALVTAHDEAIRRNWISAIRDAWQNDGTERWPNFREILDRGRDCFSLLTVRLAAGTRTAGREHEQSTIERIQSEVFVISDLFFEISTLKRCVQAEASENAPAATLFTIFTCLDEFFDAVIRDTSNIYEHVSELGDRGLVLFNGLGVVTYANSHARRLLKRGDLPGEQLSNLIPEDGMAQIEAVISDRQSDSTWTNEVPVTLGDGGADVMTIEIAAVAKPTERAVGYLALSEPGLGRIAILKALETFDHGVIRVNLTTQRILYLNRKGQRIFGVEDTANLFLFDLVTDPNSRDRLKEAGARRLQGHADVIEDILVQRPDNGKQVPIRLMAVPEPNLMGEVRSSFAFFESRELEHIETRLDNVIADAGQDWQRILEATTHELSNYVTPLAGSQREGAVEQITFSRFSQSEVFGRVEFDWDNAAGRRLKPWSVHWYKHPPARLAWLKREKVQNELLDEFLSRPENAELRDDEMVQGLRAKGIARFLFRPIFRNGQIVAGVSFLSSDPEAYTQTTQRLLEEFPLDKPVLAALANENVSADRQLNQLVGRLISCSSMKRVAEVLVNGIVAQYKWSNVAMFRINDYDKTADLIVQVKSKENGYLLPRWIRQPLKKGLIGVAAHQGKTIQCDDVETDRRYARHYVAGRKRTRSELVVPIRLSGRVCWVLNIEDWTLRAFSDEEVEQIQFLVRQCELLLDGLAARYIHDTALKETSDAVFIADHCGNIRYMNPSAKAQLGYPMKRGTARRRPRTLSDLFVDPRDAETFRRDPHLTARRVKMRRIGAAGADEEAPDTTEMLVSMFQLPEELRDRYLVGKDLDRHKRLERHADLRHVFGQVAREARAPLSNLHGLFHRLERRSPDNPLVEEFVERAQRQLRRLGVLNNRLAFYDDDGLQTPRAKVLIDLHSLIAEISEDLCDAEAKIVDAGFAAGEAEVIGDPYQLRFVFETILGFFLPNLPVESAVKVTARSQDGSVTTELSAPVSQRCLASITGDQVAERDSLVSELLLGTQTVDRFVNDHGGSFAIEPLDSCHAGFRVTLPAAEV